MSRLGRLWSKIEGSNRANCDSSNQQFTHGTFLSSGVFSRRLHHTALPDLLTRRAFHFLAQTLRRLDSILGPSSKAKVSAELGSTLQNLCKFATIEARQQKDANGFLQTRL
jgi:hypothetical protein